MTPCVPGRVPSCWSSSQLPEPSSQTPEPSRSPARGQLPELSSQPEPRAQPELSSQSSAPRAHRAGQAVGTGMAHSYVQSSARAFGSDLSPCVPSLGPACGCCGCKTWAYSRCFQERYFTPKQAVLCTPAQHRVPTSQQSLAILGHVAQSHGNWGQGTAPGWGTLAAGALPCLLLLVHSHAGLSTALLRIFLNSTWEFMAMTPIFVFTPINT